jgi:hypothetical protein
MIGGINNLKGLNEMSYKTKAMILMLIILYPTIIFADNKLVSSSQSGVQITPLKKMNIPESFKKELLTKIAEEKLKGYREEDNKYVKELISINREGPDEIKAFSKSNNPLDTHLKANITDVKLAFSFKEIPMPNQGKIIGYVPAGGYYKANEPDNLTSREGWSGIKVFFNVPSVGTCSYTYFNLIASHGAVQLNKDTTRYIVNNKPSSSIVEGSYNSGFMYSVEWFGKADMHSLECANMLFDKKIKDDVIALANIIDKQG